MRNQKSFKRGLTKSKKSKLVEPVDGDINVAPQSEILIAFEVEGESWETDVFVEIDGDRVVENGVAKNGWTTTRFYRHGNFAHVGVRKPGGLPERDIFVKAWCRDAFTVDQRFFVRGASTHARKPENGVKISNGWFSIGGEWNIRGKKYEEMDHLGHGIPFRDLCAVYPQDGTVGFFENDHVEWRFVPQDIFDGMRDVDMVRLDGEYLMIVVADHEVRFVKPDFLRVFEDRVQSVEITDQFVNISQDDCTYHLPVSYEPHFNEDSFDSWYKMTCEREGPWRHRFGDGLFLWVQDDEMVAKIDPDPFLDDSDDILWRRNDVQTDLRNIDILDNSHIVVNNEVFVDVRNPRLEQV